VLLFVILAIDFLFLAWSHPPTRRVVPSSLQPGRRDRVFIASVHRNSELILRAHWNDAVIALARYFGPENVFISVYESGSQDNTKDILKDLDVELGKIGVAKKIILGMTVDAQVAEISNAPPEEEEGWILTDRGSIEPRRIPHLAKTRNKAMEPLETEADMGRKYDFVIWLNDVFFTVRIIIPQVLPYC
jgi:Cryptococcal mannosyltransferase 1